MKRAFFLLFIGLAFLFLSSCAETNVDTIRGGVVQINDYRDFIGTEGQVWKALISALSEKEIIKTFDRGSGLVVTEYGTVAGRELKAIKTLLLATTYKYSYTVNLLSRSGNRTRIKVKVNLLGQQVGFYEREVSDVAVEKYLTKDLFDRVCSSLSPGNPYGCSDSQAKSNFSQRQTPSVNRLPSSQKITGNSRTRAVQQRLLDLGYDPGQADGKMGKKTRNAIIRFQKDNRLTAHSKLDMITLQTLGVNGVPEKVPQLAVEKKRVSPPQDLIDPDKQPEQDKPVPEGGEQIKTVFADTPSSKQGSQVEKAFTEHIYITLSPTIVKKEDSVMSENLGKIAENSNIIVLQEGGTWHKVRFKQQTGYILANLVEKRKGGEKNNTAQEETPTKKQREDRKKSATQPIAEERVKTVPAAQNPAPIPEPKSIGMGTINGATYLYSKPSVISSKQLKLRQGKRVEIYDEQKGFYKIKIGKKKGFVYKDFVDIGNDL